MIAGLTATQVGVIGFCIVTETGREVCFKLAARKYAFGVKVFVNPITALGVVFWSVELVAWCWVLGAAPLSIAFPLMSASYATIALAGAALFGERINGRHALGIAMVIIGVATVGSAGL
ncbi:MAG: Permease of the drug/metabolite transporter superfamily [Proteobacteria bacterium]|nr:Permease of the drug/metabolite transporter superfamily [Pseudomonadota bacterium]